MVNLQYVWKVAYLRSVKPKIMKSQAFKFDKDLGALKSIIAISLEIIIKTLKGKKKNQSPDKLITNLQTALHTVQRQLTRNNLKIINQPLDTEQQKLLLNYIEGCLQEIFSLLADFKLEIMDAYRLRAIGNPSQRPAPIIVTFLTSSTRGQLLKLSRQPTKLKYHG